jgi:hypothetical protein
MFKNQKLEFFVDFKGGKCLKFDTRRNRKPSDAISAAASSFFQNSKDTNNNLSNKEKEKERQDIMDIVGTSKHSFTVSSVKKKNFYNFFLKFLNRFCFQSRSKP